MCWIDVCWLSAQACRKEGGGVKTEQIVAKKAVNWKILVEDGVRISYVSFGDGLVGVEPCLLAAVDWWCRSV